MSKLTIHDWNKSKVTFNVHSWEPAKKLAVISNAKQGVMFMRFILPPFTDGSTKAESSFPDAPPHSIKEVRLVPPPCRANVADARALRLRARMTSLPARLPQNAEWESAWELVRLAYDDEILTPTTDDEKALLQKFSWLSGGGDSVVGDWMVESTARHPFNRDPYLQERWAKENDRDLGQMDEDRIEALRWAGLTHDGVLRAELVFGDREAAGNLLWQNETAFNRRIRDAEFFFGAAIRFHVKFADKSESEAWLKDCVRESGKTPVTIGDCCDELDVRPRQYRSIVKDFNDGSEPRNKGELYVLTEKYERHRKHNEESKKKNLRAWAESRRGRSSREQ